MVSCLWYPVLTLSHVSGSHILPLTLQFWFSALYVSTCLHHLHHPKTISVAFGNYLYFSSLFWASSFCFHSLFQRVHVWIGELCLPWKVTDNTIGTSVGRNCFWDSDSSRYNNLFCLTFLSYFYYNLKTIKQCQSTNPIRFFLICLNLNHLMERITVNGPKDYRSSFSS